MANRQRDFRSFCGATERIRNVQRQPMVGRTGVVAITLTQQRRDKTRRGDACNRPETLKRQVGQHGREGEGERDRARWDASARQRCYLFRICLPSFFIYVWQTPIFMAAAMAATWLCLCLWLWLEQRLTKGCMRRWCGLSGRVLEVPCRGCG